MKAFVITLEGNAYSEDVAQRCIDSAAKFGLDVEKYYGVNRTHAKEIMEQEGLEWKWAHNNTKADVCPITGLRQHPYTAADTTLADLDSKIGCSMSHFLMWKFCSRIDEPLLILEHDAVFLRPLPKFEFNGICQINDPQGATPRGKWWHDQMVQRGTEGVHEKTWIRGENERQIPDGLAGNSAYLIKPWAAEELVNKAYEVGLWPNDALMCKQLFPYLEEYYPFITKAVQKRSTSTGK